MQSFLEWSLDFKYSTYRRCGGSLLVGLLLLLFSSARAQENPRQPTFVYLTQEEALEEAFPEASTFLPDTVRLSPEEVQEGLRKTRVEMDSVYQVFLAYGKDGRFLGYAMIVEEVGKYEPITFIVAITPNFKVRKVAIMVYREGRGGEVRYPRFLYQYKGKTARDPVRVRRDIVNISGATLSVRAVNRGVRKALFVVTTYYRAHPPAQKLEGHE